MRARPRALVEAGHSVRFTPTYQLVQEILAAKRDLELPRLLALSLCMGKDLVSE